MVKHHKPDDISEEVLRHQKLCLAIDMDKRLIYGFTELQIVVPDNGIIGLHADNLVIHNVLVDGEPARFQMYPHYDELKDKNRQCFVSSASFAAQAAGSVYISTLEYERVPNLLVMCSRNEKSSSEEKGQKQYENELQPLNESKQNVKLVHIDYSVETAETGIHFENNVLHTDNQLRRSGCWFPCMDDSTQRCCYDMEFTVASNLVAISTGNLLFKVLSNDDPPRTTYVYRLNVPVTANWISLAVASFAIFADHDNLSHFCMPCNLPKLQNTVEFFHSAFSHYEEYLKTSFPLGSYTQVFIPTEMAISSMSLGASMTIFSSHLLFDDKVIDQLIETRIKLAYALARQWFGVYITAESSNDEWLLDGLAWFLTNSFVKKFLGHNEARYRRYKENYAVCKFDDSGATVLSSSAASQNLHGTQCIGLYGKIRSWKSVAVLKMLEKQMGPESFRKILQTIVLPSPETNHSLRTLSTNEFRHFSKKFGNLDRSFLKDFFNSWVGYCGCPELRMGYSYCKKNIMIKLATLRGCTAPPESKESNIEWPGMMSIRVHDIDGMYYDHPILPMYGDTLELFEIKCQSRKNSLKSVGYDDGGVALPGLHKGSDVVSQFFWLRADPEMEYLAEIHFYQPVQMWLNQLRKDKDVVAEAQAIAVLETLPLSFSVVNALSIFLNNSEAFWRVRIEAAVALANTTIKDTDLAGLIHLIEFYKSRRFDAYIRLPKPNDFSDFAEHFVLEAIPNAIAMVRTADKKSPPEAVKFILKLLKHNDNTGNPFSDVFWIAALVQSMGELEFGTQNIFLLPSVLKRIDHIIQLDRFNPSHNAILTTSCIRTLTQVAMKLSQYINIDQVTELINPFRDLKERWFVRIVASKAMLDLQFHYNGIDAALQLFMKFIEEEPTFRGQKKLSVHMSLLCQIRGGGSDDPVDDVKAGTLNALIHLLQTRMSFNNMFLRHYIFCILQILAGRAPTLFGVSRDGIRCHTEILRELKSIFAEYYQENKSLVIPDLSIQERNSPLQDDTVSTVRTESHQKMEIKLKSSNGNVSNNGVTKLKFKSLSALYSPQIEDNKEQKNENRGSGEEKDSDYNVERKRMKIERQEVELTESRMLASFSDQKEKQETTKEVPTTTTSETRPPDAPVTASYRKIRFILKER